MYSITLSPSPSAEKFDKENRFVLLHKSKFWSRDVYFRVSQIQIFFWKIAWGRGTSCLLVRQERLLYLSTILRNKSVSKSLVYSFNITQTPYIAGWLLLWSFLLGWLHSELFPLKFPKTSPISPKFPQIFQILHFLAARPAGWNN